MIPNEDNFKECFKYKAYTYPRIIQNVSAHYCNKGHLEDPEGGRRL